MNRGRIAAMSGLQCPPEDPSLQTINAKKLELAFAREAASVSPTLAFA